MAKETAMLRSVFLKSIRDQRRSLIWWGLGLVLLTVVTLLFYPSVRTFPELNELLAEQDSLIRAFIGDVPDLTSPEGYLNSQLFFLMLPLLIIGFAIAQGSGAIAGEEEKGTLDMLLSNPIERWRVVVEKYGAMMVTVVALAGVTWVGLAAGALAVAMDISYVKMAEAMLAAALLGMAFGAFALALGSATGKRAKSIGIAAGVGVAGYFVNALAPVVDVLEPIRRVSPFHYYSTSDPLTNGLHLGHIGVLVALSAALLAVAVVTFQRRDLGV
jgi:ABC-2 type transport system permease protein